MFRVRRVGRRSQKPTENLTVDLPIPENFQCPISLDLMKDPVTLSTGITYDRQNIDAWLDAGNRTCPFTNQELKSLEQIPNRTLMRRIQQWSVENHSLGIERIPTPRIPTTPAEVSGILAGIANASRCSSSLIECRELVKKISVLGSEGERNRHFIEADETALGVFAGAFEAFSDPSVENYADVLEEILSMLAWMLPLDDKARSHLGSHSSLSCLVWFLNCGNLAGRRNAVLAVKDLASSSSKEFSERLMETEGLIEALVKVLKEPICPKVTKASLTAIFYLVSSSPPSSDRFVEMGLLPFLLEMLVDSDKSVSERVLSVLDGILGCEGGREKAYNHALAVPVLVKKVLRVSNLATEFAISALWKLCKNWRGEDEEGGILVEVLQVGAFQKVLLVLQVGCSERTKEKATELLKLLNGYRVRDECIESMDFKQVKRPF